MGYRYARPTLIIALLLAAIVMGPGVQAAWAQQERPSPYVSEYWPLDDMELARVYGLINEEAWIANPDAYITREELCALAVNLYEAFVQPQFPVTSPSPFLDTDSDVMARAYAWSIVVGTGENLFTPHRRGTRQEAAVMVYNAMKSAAPQLPYLEDTLRSFDDEDITPFWARTPLRYMITLDLLQPRSERVLGSWDPITRRDAIVFVTRAYEHLVHSTSGASKGLFFEVSGGESTVYLLAYPDAADPGAYPLSETIEEAFAEADYLAVEANVLHQQQHHEYGRQLGLITDGTTLRGDHISLNNHRRLRLYLEGIGMDIEEFDVLKPWAAALRLEELREQPDTPDPIFSPLHYFLVRGEESHELLQIGDIGYPFDAFDSFDRGLAEDYLVHVLTSLIKAEEDEDDPEPSATALQLWISGDLQDFEAAVQGRRDETSHLPGFNQLVWTNRDRELAEAVMEYLSDEEENVYFVLVGGEHLAPGAGIIAFLEDAEYTVTQLID